MWNSKVRPSEKVYCDHTRQKRKQIQNKIRARLRDSPRVISLTQKDFDEGTYRISQPGRYVLQEDIVFGPHPEHNYRPLPGSSYALDPAYSLGFFAAIAIECDQVEIDLNSHALRQEARMAWMQRFYANIETSSSPFLPGEGPGKFGDSVRAPRYLWIHHGTLGRSSHHAIHGNGNRYVWIDQVTMVDFEFVGSAWNGVQKMVHSRCSILGNFQKIAVLASWSSALYMQQFAREMLKLASDPDLSRHERILTRIIDQTQRELFSGSLVTHPLFRNPSQLADGNVYGILSHPLGVAIHAFTTEKRTEGLATHFYVHRCQIENLVGKVDEVLSLTKGPELLKGPSGDLVQISSLVQKDGTYRPNVLSSTLFSMARFLKRHPEAPSGTLHIPSEVLDWVDGKISFPELLAQGYSYVTGVDSMGHIGKGVLGIRIDGTRHAWIEQTQISQIHNRARGGLELPRRSEPSVLYAGTQAHGIHVSWGRNMGIFQTCISHIVSSNGQAAGIKYVYHSQGFLGKNSIQNIQAGEKESEEGRWMGTNFYGEETNDIPSRINPLPTAFGICWDVSSHVVLREIQVEKLQGPQVFFGAIIETPPIPLCPGGGCPIRGTSYQVHCTSPVCTVKKREKKKKEKKSIK